VKTPEISEFSYGFALTNEIAGWAPLRIAPIFPSLVEEGKKGGGYDVKLDIPGVPLYLQFKRGYRMTRRTAKEVKQYKKRLNMPFHRFYITDSGTSAQHTMLLELDDGKSNVFYAAPRFDLTAEINDAWVNKQVAQRSIFVRPRAIGILDDQSHHVAYDAQRTYVCSEPKEIEALSAAQLVHRLLGKLQADPRPLRETLSGLCTDADNAAKRAQERIAQRAFTTGETKGLAGLPSLYRFPSWTLPPALSTPQVPWRDYTPLSESNRQLRELADKAYKLFDVQVMIVQSSKPSA
jgi:hypothetical protein